MNKFILAVCFVFVFSVSVFAQNTEYQIPDTSDLLKVEIVEGKISSEDLKKVGKVAIEFMPAFDEARFVYVCPAPLFEQSTAMLAIKESIASFIKDRGYYFYTYLKSDDTRYDSETKTAIYTSYVQLLH